MREEHLAHAEQPAKAGRSRLVIRHLHRLRGEWQLEQGQRALAAESLHEAVHMAREIGQSDAVAETLLAVAKFHLNQLSETPGRQRSTRLQPTSGHGQMASLTSAATN